MKQQQQIKAGADFMRAAFNNTFIISELQVPLSIYPYTLHPATVLMGMAACPLDLLCICHSVAEEKKNK